MCANQTREYIFILQCVEVTDALNIVIILLSENKHYIYMTVWCIITYYSVYTHILYIVLVYNVKLHI